MDAHTSRVRGSSHRGGTEMCRSTAGTVSAASSVWVRSKHPATSQALSLSGRCLLLFPPPTPCSCSLAHVGHHLSE